MSAPRRRPGTVRPAAAAFAALCLLGTPTAGADTGSSGAGTLPRSATANLDFSLSIGKLLFFRIGQAAWPATGSTPGSVAFTLSPSIPAVPTVPLAGNNQAANWSGAPPSFSVGSATQVLPVEVRSNAGTVTLQATATAALTAGSAVIPLSEILIASSDGSLPAPPVPATGNGASVVVGGTAFANLVTVRTADWTFSYANSASRPAGSYIGQVTFTASTP